MSNVSYTQALAILSGWPGTPRDKYRQWEQTYNHVAPPPPPAAYDNDSTLAQYIADHYDGPPIPT